MAGPLTAVGALLLAIPPLPSCPVDDPLPRQGECRATFVDPFFLFFERDSAQLTRAGAATLDNAVAAFRMSPGARVLISGHTGDFARREEAFRLSWRRAEAARRYLLGRHIPAANLFVRAFGAGRPLVSTRNGTIEPRNDRVELILVPAGE